MARKYNFIYKRLVKDGTDLTGHIAYSLYKSEKISWIEQYKKDNDGKEPTETDFEQYHKACCSERRIENYLAMAETTLQTFMLGSAEMMTEQVAEEVSEKVTKHINDNIATRIPKRESMVCRYFHGSMQSVIGTVLLAFLVWLMVAVVSKFSISDFEIEFRKKEPQIENVEKTPQERTPVVNTSQTR